MTEARQCKVCAKPATWLSGTYGGKYPSRALCEPHKTAWFAFPKEKRLYGPTGRFRPKMWQVVFNEFLAAEKKAKTVDSQGRLI